MVKRKVSGEAIAEVDESKKPKQDPSAEKLSPRKPKEPTVATSEAVESGTDPLKYLQIIITGPEKCGKSCLVLSYMGQLFPFKNSKFLSKQYLRVFPESDKKTVMIWDLDSSDKFKNYRWQSYPEADVAFLCFDIEKPKHLKKDGNKSDALINLLNPWYVELEAHCKKVKTILVGLKGDLKVNSEGNFFNDDEIKRVRNDWKIEDYVEISALTDKDGVNDLFNAGIALADQPNEKTMFANCGFEFYGPKLHA